jgi:hypothetical protein
MVHRGSNHVLKAVLCSILEIAMKLAAIVCFAVMFCANHGHCEETPWYTGDDRCPPPKDNGTYSSPYNALDHRQEFPTFPDADKPGWSCSYQREDGVVVQYGDSRSPQQQWVAIWGDNKD